MIILVFGAGAVWTSKYKPALSRLQREFAEDGKAFDIWLAEKDLPGEDAVVERRFCMDEDRSILKESLSEVDLAIIATWNDQHIPMLRFLDGQVPCVLIEKPLADNVEDALSVQTLFEEWKGVRIWGIDHFLSKPALQSLFRLKREGKLTPWIEGSSRLMISIREEGRIDPNRKILLNSGLFDDLLIHSWQMVVELLDLRSTDDVTCGAAFPCFYEGATIEGETGGRVQAKVGHIDIVLLVGKGLLSDKRLRWESEAGIVDADLLAGSVTLTIDDGVEEISPATADQAYYELLKEAVHLAL